MTKRIGQLKKSQRKPRSPESYLRELAKFSFVPSYNAHLKAQGYVYVSEGVDSMVWRHPSNKGRVLKTTEKSTSNATLRWYRFIEKHPSVHFIKVFDIDRFDAEINRRYYQTSLEQLKPLPKRMQAKFRRWFDGLTPKEIRETESLGTTIYDHIKYLAKVSSGYNLMLDLVDQEDPKGFTNVMLRGDVPVITDPWVNYL